MKKTLVITIIGVALTGCGPAAYIDQATAKYDAVENQVKLGDSKDKVLAILLPTQESVPRNNRKKSDKYMKDGVAVEIYYMRTGRQPDGITTDDEFTPYLFNDDILVGIGWEVIGGEQSHGKAIRIIY